MPAKNGVDGTLYTYPNNPRASLIQISAQYGGSDVKLASNFEYGVTNTSPEFKSKFPFGQVPAFESSEGCLFDTMAIASFVGGSTLRGAGEFARAQVTQWTNVAETQLFSSACAVLYPCWGIMPNNKNVVGKGKEALKNFMTNLNQHLESRTYLVGECVTLADLALFAYMRDLYVMIFDEAQRTAYSNVTRWFTTIMNQDEVLRVVGVTALCLKPAQFDPKLFAINNPKQKKEPAPKKEQPKKAEAKKEEKPKEEAPKKAPVKKPFEGLPNAKLDLDSFKRLYWNEQKPEPVVKYFDENFVEGEWSMWKMEYKFPKELTIKFKTNNLVKGMYQRLETMKKWAFGLMYVYGEGSSFAIGGVWMGRGGGNFFLEDENWTQDIPSYNLTKLDMQNPTDKKYWTDFVAGTVEEWDGLPFVQDHIF